MAITLTNSNRDRITLSAIGNTYEDGAGDHGSRPLSKVCLIKFIKDESKISLAEAKDIADAVWPALHTLAQSTLNKEDLWGAFSRASFGDRAEIMRLLGVEF